MTKEELLNEARKFALGWYDLQPELLVDFCLPLLAQERREAEGRVLDEFQRWLWGREPGSAAYELMNFRALARGEGDADQGSASLRGPARGASQGQTTRLEAGSGGCKPAEAAADRSTTRDASLAAASPPAPPSSSDAGALRKRAEELLRERVRWFELMTDDTVTEILDAMLAFAAERVEAAYMAANKTAYERGYSHGCRDARARGAEEILRDVVESIEARQRRRIEWAKDYTLSDEVRGQHSAAVVVLDHALSDIRALRQPAAPASGSTETHRQIADLHGESATREEPDQAASLAGRPSGSPRREDPCTEGGMETKRCPPGQHRYVMAAGMMSARCYRCGDVIVEKTLEPRPTQETDKYSAQTAAVAPTAPRL